MATRKDAAGGTFGAGIDDRVAGQIVVKLSAQGARGVTASIPSGPMRNLAEVPATFGSAALDAALAGLKVQGIARVHSPIPGAVMAGEVTGDDPVGGAASRSVSGSIAETLNSTFRIKLDPAADLDKAVAKLSAVKDVLAAEPARFRINCVTPNDPMYGMEWGLTKINCPDAWARTTGSASVVVAVIDTGADLDHPDLAANLKLPGRDMVDLTGASAPAGWHFEGDFVTRDDTPQDEVGHGTHVSGTIAAVSNNATGVAGVTWICKILPVRVLARTVRNSDGVVSGMGSSVDIAAGIRWAADNGAHIINMSLGGSTKTFVEEDAVAYAVSKGVLVVVAMGNDNTSAPSYPAAFPNVLAVGATDQMDKRAVFSNFGPHIGVVAPGVSIRSTDWDNTYSNKSGTSMATPHVAGLAALIKSCKFSLTAAQIADIIKTTAKPLKDSPADPIPNDKYGFGLIDAKAALAKACPLVKPKFVVDPGPGKWKKVLDDPQPKFQVDPKFKFFDDPKRKVIDDVKLKFRDDPKFKLIDDGIPKGFDVPGGPGPGPGPGPRPGPLGAGPSVGVPWLPKNPTQDKFKFRDDKRTWTDKPVWWDRPKFKKILDDPMIPQPGIPIPQPGPLETGGAQPFVLATPHHSQAWAASYPGAYEQSVAEMEAQLAQYHEILSQYEQAAQAGQLSAEEQQQAAALAETYAALLAEYQQVTGQA